MRKEILTLIILISAIFMSEIMANDTIPSGPTVDISTTLGDIKVRLYDDTPAHRDNFLKLVNEGFYDGVLFHRVIKDFMVQTGDPNSKTAGPNEMLGAGDPNYTLDAEILYPKHYHKYGALAAARTGDQFNPERRSSGSQFYIVTGNKFPEERAEEMAKNGMGPQLQNRFRELVNENADSIKALQTAGDREGLDKLRMQLIKDTEESVLDMKQIKKIAKDYSTVGGTPHLDGQYTVFGEVISGMDTVEKIQNAATGKGDRPVEDIRIINMKVEK